MSIQGEVTAAHSYWTNDGSRIVTEATVHTSTGDVTVSQLGGSADGYGMIQFPTQAVILEPGMQVTVDAHHAVDTAQNDHVAVDAVKVTAYPPGYVRTGPTKAGHYLFWESGCIFVTPDSAGTKAISGDGAFQAIDQAFATWNNSTASCSYMKVKDAGAKPMEVGNDKINTVKFRDDTWGRPAVDGDPARTYSPSAAGITTVVYVDDGTNPRDGAIVDADIEINAVNFHVTLEPDPNDPAFPGEQNAVLLNTLTHEVGHLHGLEHTCRLSDAEPMRIDNNGNPVPLCMPPNDPPAIANATMYPTQVSGETSKETLSNDDIQSMCDIYPTAKDPNTCAPVAGAPSSGGGGGCNSGPSNDLGILVSGSAIALPFAGRRRRKSAPRG